MWTSPDLPFLAGEPEEEEASPFLEPCLDQRVAFFLTDLNLCHWLKLSLEAGVIVIVSSEEGLGVFLSHLPKQSSHNLCCLAWGLKYLPHDAQTLATNSSIMWTEGVRSRRCLLAECEDEKYDTETA